MNTSIPIPGCRHDILGHNLKAIGLLRVLATCADAEHRDPEAEGWWDLATATFHLRSSKYPTFEALVDFFEKAYRPTPVFSPWNTGGGMDEKEEIVFSINPRLWRDYWTTHREKLLAHGFPQPQADETPDFPERSFDLKSTTCMLPSTDDLEIKIVTSGTKKPKTKVSIGWSESALKSFFSDLNSQRTVLEQAIKFTKPVIKKFTRGKSEYVFDLQNETVTSQIIATRHVCWEIRTKEKGKKAVMARLANESKNDSRFIAALELGREFFEKFQKDNVDQSTLLEEFRDRCPPLTAESLDSIFTTRAASRPMDNPLFLNRGDAGASEVFRSFWVYWQDARESKGSAATASLLGTSATNVSNERLASHGKGSPFFPDAIKTYNNGLGWVVESFPFNALDYLLAVEGALALRGAASRTLAANSRRFAAFPFVFDSGEDLVDDSNEVKGTASSIWLPLWDREATFAELSSFICDAQARLPGKEARFSAEFARALRAQGVDAGFSGWQEFRFKMKASRVPWVCTGRYLGATSDRHSIRLNDALAPLDESGFLDQFEPRYKGNKIDARSPHPIRASIGAAIEDTVVQPTPDNAMEILLRLYPACGKLAQSKSFRETLRQRATFFDPLPMKQWEDLLEGFGSPEFRIAQALASITGLSKQTNGKFSRAQPFLGSLLPLNLEYGHCRLEENSKQAVWSGADLGHDLARVLSRRYLDSLDDKRPAIMSPRPAPLEDILALLNGELDDYRIARWIEALSLIGWHFEKQEENPDSSLSSDEQSLQDEKRQFPAIPLAYATLRSLLEMECEWQGNDSSLWKKRRSHRPISLLCQRTPSSLAPAVEDALRWLAIWGVPNCWGEAARREKPRLGGRDIIRADHRELSFGGAQSRLVTRLAAAVLIPLDWRDRGKLYRAVTLPQSVEH